MVCAALQAKTEAINGWFLTAAPMWIFPAVPPAPRSTPVKGAKETMGASGAHTAAFWPKAAIGDKVFVCPPWRRP